MKTRKIIALIMSLSMVASMTACGGTTPPPASSVTEPTSSSTSASEDNEAATQQEKKALADKILSGELDVSDSPDYVQSGNNGSTNLEHVKQLLASRDKGESYSFMGLMGGGTIPVVYEVESYPDGGVALTTYTKEYPGIDISPVNRYAATDIYIADSFYQFTDNKGMFLSVPRHSLEQVEVEGYLENSDLAGATVTAAQACDTATEMIGLLYGAIGHARENGDINIMNSYGVIVPQGTVLDPTVTEQQLTPKTGGAVMVAEEQYYRVDYYFPDGERAGEVWLVSASNPNHIFLVSMVDGSLIPVAYNGYKHIELK